MSYCTRSNTDSLPDAAVEALPHLSEHVDSIAREKGKSASSVVQDALRLAMRERFQVRYREIQGYCSAEAERRGIVSEEDLERYLSE